MTVLGIDPGLNHFGFGVIIEEGSLIRALGYGGYQVSREFSFEEKLGFIRGTFNGLADKYVPDAVAIERIYVAKNPQIALNIGMVAGVIAGAALDRRMRVLFLSPREIKKNLVGEGGAFKDQVSFMVGKILNLKEVPDPDASDALATALSYLTVRKFNALTENL